MDVIIQEVVSTVRAVNGDALLSERTLARIVQAVTAAIEGERRREKLRDADTSTDVSTQNKER